MFFVRCPQSIIIRAFAHSHESIPIIVTLFLQNRFWWKALYFYRVSEHGLLHRMSRYMLAFYAIKLPYPGIKLHPVLTWILYFHARKNLFYLELWNYASVFVYVCIISSACPALSIPLFLQPYNICRKVRITRAHHYAVYFRRPASRISAHLKLSWMRRTAVSLCVSKFS